MTIREGTVTTMSRFDDVINMFKTLPLTTVDLDHVKVGTKTPFGVYTFEIDTTSADNGVYVKGYQFTLSIYVPKLSSKLDNDIETAFQNNDIVWTRSAPTWVEDSNVFQYDYTFGVLG